MFAATHVGQDDHNPLFRIDRTVGSASWDAAVRRGSRVHSKVLAECTAVGFTAIGVDAWDESSLDVTVEAVGIPAYPGNRLPRVAGLLVRDRSASPAESISYVTGDAARPEGPGHGSWRMS